jgi:hypothetical protein
MGLSFTCEGFILAIIQKERHGEGRKNNAQWKETDREEASRTFAHTWHRKRVQQWREVTSVIPTPSNAKLAKQNMRGGGLCTEVYALTSQ